MYFSNNQNHHVLSSSTYQNWSTAWRFTDRFIIVHRLMWQWYAARRQQGYGSVGKLRLCLISQSGQAISQMVTAIFTSMRAWNK